MSAQVFSHLLIMPIPLSFSIKSYLCVVLSKGMLKTVILAILAVGILVLLLGIKVFFTKKGQFPNTHVDGNDALQKQGISCASSQDEYSRKRKNLFDLMRGN